jgi:hypothetical protein
VLADDGSPPGSLCLVEASAFHLVQVVRVDVFTVQAGFPFDPDELAQRLRRYAETVYAFFRFATTEAFQEAHRGEPAPIAGEAL